jgi:hypothetical protein
MTLREGPCVVTYRDRKWNGHPTRRGYSCLGCQHLRVGELRDTYCQHPAFIEAYEVEQFNRTLPRGTLRVICEPHFCPALRLLGVRDWPEQPDADPIAARPEYDHRDDALRELQSLWAMPVGMNIPTETVDDMHD